MFKIINYILLLGLNLFFVQLLFLKDFESENILHDLNPNLNKILD